MKSFVFTGNVDKRILTMLVASGLSNLGETLIVTDDPNFVRGSENNRFGGIAVLLEANITDETLEKYDDGVDYINVIYDTRSFIPKEADGICICRRKDRTLTPKEILAVSDELDKNGDIVTPTKEVVITYAFDKKELKKAHYTYRGEREDILGKADVIELKPTDLKWLMMCEEINNIAPIKNAALTGEVAKLTCDVVGMSQKEWEAIINKA